MKRVFLILICSIGSIGILSFGIFFIWAGRGSLSLDSIMASVKGLGGIKTLGLLAAVVQALNLILRGFIERISGFYKVLAISVMTLILGVLVLRMQGMTWFAAILHSQTTAMAQVYFHQLMKQFLKKPKDDYLVLTKRGSL